MTAVRPVVLLVLGAALLLLLSALAGVLPRPDGERAFLARENAHRANNLGVGLMEQVQYGEAADSFRHALDIHPGLALARFNLALALYHLADFPAAEQELAAAREQMPDAPQVYFLQGLIAKGTDRPGEAVRAFLATLARDPGDAATHINLAQLALQLERHGDAIPSLERALEREPYNVTAAYNLMVALRRAGRVAESARALAAFEALREGGYGTALGLGYLEQGPYSGAMVATGVEPGLIDPATPEVGFVRSRDPWPAPGPVPREPRTPPPPGAPVDPAGLATGAGRQAFATAFAGSLVLLDCAGDGTLDLFTTGRDGDRLWRNDAGRFTEATADAGFPSPGVLSPGIAAVAGDYDNDGLPDVLVVRYGALTLYRNEGNCRFTDVTEAAGLRPHPHLALTVAFADVDHDGDLDIVLPGFVDLAGAARADPAGTRRFPADFPGAPTLLLRNNGDGTFTDVAAEAGLSAVSHAVALVPTDFDNRRDVDLLIVKAAGGPALFRNMRDGSFVDVADEVGLPSEGDFSSAAAGDINKDGYIDFFFGRPEAPGIVALSDGLGAFTLHEAPAGTAGALAAQLADYDNDGLLDLLIFTAHGPRAFRNTGRDWVEVTSRAFAGWPAGPGWPVRAFAMADLDGDGALDLAVPGAAGAAAVWINEGGRRNGSLRARLVAQVSNRSGIGARVEMRSGSLAHRAETYAASPAPAPADLVFGLGGRDGADLLRVLWPAGILQAEIPPAGEAAVASARRTPPIVVITELDRKPSSCPYLYAWNGERFAFVTDFLGGGELGYWLAPGVRNQPDPDEFVRIRPDQLQPLDGFYELRVTNELEETLFLDHVRLLAVDHPADLLVYPEEGMLGQPRIGLRLVPVRHPHPPAAAVDHRGRDVLDRVRDLDRRAPDAFELHPIRGYAEEHSLTLVASGDEAPPAVLLLTGWTDYAFSSDNVAAHQAGLGLQPPALQVRDAAGRWQTVLPEVGIPVGRPQTVVVDLRGSPAAGHREFRIVTNMRIYWDQVLFAEAAENAPVRTSSLEPARADLRWRGFSASVTPDGREPLLFDYASVSPASPWKQIPGRYTREGDVRELLAAPDDLFVISRPGDEIALSFEAGRLPGLPAGWARTFVLHAEGFSKEMDLNSATPDDLGPLPFRGMSGYPYALPERFPMTSSRRAQIERHTTREVRGVLPSLETSLLQALADRLRRLPAPADTER